ncbi:hypothetical protein VNO78_16386 [Psophocarpus tetragonolobus]|uniref:Uncharacterized protein n=1 Tax=Psophocarpus tetragonolobus TaxID=3891 RepID=A0AAN9SI89_PSOTE
MTVLHNKILALVLFILHFLLAVLIFPLYMQPEPPEVTLCLGVIPCFVLVYVTITLHNGKYMQNGYLIPFESELMKKNYVDKHFIHQFIEKIRYRMESFVVSVIVSGRVDLLVLILLEFESEVVRDGTTKGYLVTAPFESSFCFSPT